MLFTFFCESINNLFAQSYDVTYEITSSANGGSGTLREALGFAQNSANQGLNVLVSFNVNSSPSLCQINEYLPFNSINDGTITFDKGNSPLEQGLQFADDTTNPTISFGIVFFLSGYNTSVYLKNITIKDFNIIHYSEDSKGGRIGLHFSGQGQNVEVINCKFINGYQDILWYATPINSVISGNEFQSNDGRYHSAIIVNAQPVLLPFTSNYKISNNEIFLAMPDGYSNIGIVFAYKDDNLGTVEIDNNIIESYQGIAVTNYNDGDLISNIYLHDNNLNNNFYALTLNSLSPDLRLENNQFINSKYTDINISVNYQGGTGPIKEIAFVNPNTLGYSQKNSGNIFDNSKNPRHPCFNIYGTHAGGIKIIGLDLKLGYVLANSGSDGVLVRESKTGFQIITGSNFNGNIQPPSFQSAKLGSGSLNVLYSLSGLNPDNGEYVVDFYKVDGSGNIVSYLGNQLIQGSGDFLFSLINSANLEIGDQIAATLSSLGGSGKIALGTSSASYATIQQNCPTISITANPTNPISIGSATGAIEIGVEGGADPYTYVWNDGVTDEDRQNLKAGKYTVTVTDSSGCSKSETITLPEPVCPPISAVAKITNTSCNTNTGAIDITISGGTSPYLYDWGGVYTTEDITNLSAGEYIVKITDKNTCSEKYSFYVSKESNIKLDFKTISPTCQTCSDGAIDLIVNGGTSPFTYQWSNSATTEDIQNLAEGEYYVIVTDAQGCTEKQSIGIKLPPLPPPTENICAQWTKTYNGTDMLTDAGFAIDVNENVYVAGVSERSNKAGVDYSVIKYDKSGNNYGSIVLQALREISNDLFLFSD